MTNSLNDAQLEILKLFSHDQSEEDLQENKSLLTTYLSDKVVREADKAFEEKTIRSRFLKNGRTNIFAVKDSPSW